MEERRVERHVEHEHVEHEHEVEREEDAAPRRRVTNVNVGPGGTTNVQESEVVEDVAKEPGEAVEHHETAVERRIP